MNIYTTCNYFHKTHRQPTKRQPSGTLKVLNQIYFYGRARDVRSIYNVLPTEMESRNAKTKRHAICNKY
jgi:hypothetical protein